MGPSYLSPHLLLPTSPFLLLLCSMHGTFWQVQLSLRLPFCAGVPSAVLPNPVLTPPMEAGFRKGTGPPHFRLEPILPGGRRFILVILLPLLSSKGFPGAKTSRGAILPLVPSGHASVYRVGPVLQQSEPLLTFPGDIYLVSS